MAFPMGVVWPPDVQSRGRKAVRTALLWTVHGEVERWASVLIDNPSVETFSLSRLACEVFPQLHASGRLVGTDWSADPIEPEVDPYELLGTPPQQSSGMLPARSANDTRAVDRRGR